MISGGEDKMHQVISSVELFVPWNNHTRSDIVCPLPSMKLRDTGHVMMERKKLTISREIPVSICPCQC